MVSSLARAFDGYEINIGIIDVKLRLKGRTTYRTEAESPDRLRGTFRYIVMGRVYMSTLGFAETESIRDISSEEQNKSGLMIPYYVSR